ncbi:hypothetical protein EVAR_98107_1 [Eumeta japonica]|uniref:Uncharacterized protein n=1 Tax=Eumeta variegata TaxID=151549 RepID=A0A4C1XLF5_EUMVA|nr:hypothetical protein EVAR_98107_1 [Eumeta japonica]
MPALLFPIRFHRKTNNYTGPTPRRLIDSPHVRERPRPSTSRNPSNRTPKSSKLRHAAKRAEISSTFPAAHAVPTDKAPRIGGNGKSRRPFVCKCRNLTNNLRERRPSTATTEDDVSAVRFMIETDKRVTYQQIRTSSGIGISQMHKIYL